MLRRYAAIGHLFVLLAATAAAQVPPQGNAPPLTLTGHKAGIAALAFTPDNRQIVSVCPSEVRTWDAATGKEISAQKWFGANAVAISPDCQSLVVAGREKVIVRDLAGTERLSLDPYGDWDRGFPFRPSIVAVAFSPDGRLLATAGSVAKVGGPHGLPGGVVTIWDAATGKALHRFERLSTGASTVTFSADGKSVAAGTNGAGGELPEPGEIRVWDLKKGEALHSFKTKPEVSPGEFSSAGAVAFSPDGKQLAAAASAGSRGRPAGLLIDEAPSAIRVVELPSGRVRHVLTGHKSGIERIVFSPDGKRLASAGGDKVVRLWDTATGKPLAALSFDAERIDALAFSPDSSRLAAGRSESRRPGEIKVWACPKD